MKKLLDEIHKQMDRECLADTRKATLALLMAIDEEGAKSANWDRADLSNKDNYSLEDCVRDNPGVRLPGLLVRLRGWPSGSTRPIHRAVSTHVWLVREDGVTYKYDYRTLIVVDSRYPKP